MGSITLIEIIGTVAFSIAGTFAAMKKKLDIFGVFMRYEWQLPRIWKSEFPT